MLHMVPKTISGLLSANFSHTCFAFSICSFTYLRDPGKGIIRHGGLGCAAAFHLLELNLIEDSAPALLGKRLEVLYEPDGLYLSNWDRRASLNSWVIFDTSEIFK